MDVFADVTLACGWGTELPSSPGSAEARAGLALEAASYPISWAPELQPAAPASAMEAECTSLSISLRTAIPLLDLAKQAAKGLGAHSERAPASQAAARWGSQGALALSHCAG